MSVRNIFGCSRIDLYKLSSKKISFIHIFSAQAEGATYHASVELKVIMNCALEIQDTAEMLRLSEVLVADGLVSLRSANPVKQLPVVSKYCRWLWLEIKQPNV